MNDQAIIRSSKKMQVSFNNTMATVDRMRIGTLKNLPSSTNLKPQSTNIRFESATASRKELARMLSSITKQDKSGVSGSAAKINRLYDLV